MEGIKEHAGKLGIGELFGLFACMVAGRSWSSIEKGIDKKKKGKSEVDFPLRVFPLVIRNLRLRNCAKNCEALKRSRRFLHFSESRDQGERAEVHQADRRRVGLREPRDDPHLQDQ